MSLRQVCLTEGFTKTFNRKINLFNRTNFFRRHASPRSGRGNPWIHWKDGLLRRVFDPSRNDEKTWFSLVYKNPSGGEINLFFYLTL